MDTAREDAGAEVWIERLGMSKISLGGYFALAERSGEDIRAAALPERYEGDRDFYSTNYYLLRGGQTLGLHVLNQGEMWFHHRGGPTRLHIFSLQEGYSQVAIGPDWRGGERLQAVVPGQAWFGAEMPPPSSPDAYSLSGCCLAPGHDHRDSALPTPDQVQELECAFPDKHDILKRLIRSS